jgi:signal transduction histidine kinase
VLPFYLSLARASQRQGMYDTATHYYYAIVSYIQEHKLQEPALLAIAYQCIGAIWTYFNDLEQGLHCVMLSEQICRQARMLPLLAGVLSNKGIIYAMKKDYRQAETCFLNALSAGREAGDLTAQRNAATNLGCLYMDLHQPKQAIDYFLEAIRIGKFLDDPDKLIVTPHYDLGKAYYQMKDFQSAEKILAPAIRQAREFSRNEGLDEAVATLSKVYATTGRYEKAYEEQRAYNKLLLQKKDNEPYVRQLEIKYRTAEKDKQLAENRLLIANQKMRLIRKNNLLWSISIGSATLIFLITLFYLNRQRRQADRMRIMKQEEEIRTWQATIKGEETERARIAHELHDSIGGQLSTISMYLGTIRKKYPLLLRAPDYEEAMALVDDTLKEVRKTAHNLMPELLLRHGLVEATRILCRKVQHAQKMTIDFQYHGAISTLSSNFELTVYRIVQELIQNILKHAAATEALVQFSVRDHILSITVEDNGIGIEEGAVEKAGVGIRSIESRIKGLNGFFTIRSIAGRGTTAYIEFDLKNKKKSLV